MLTACFSLNSRSFFNLSLISLSLTTHAAASFAASSGLDLFFNKSMVGKGDDSNQRTTTNLANFDLQPCNAATLNSSSGIESANSFASLDSVAPSNGRAECSYFAISSSIMGGRYA